MKRRKQKHIEPGTDISATRRGQRQRKPTAKCLELMSSISPHNALLDTSRQFSVARACAGKSGKIADSCVKNKETITVQNLSHLQSGLDKSNFTGSSCHNKVSVVLNKVDFPVECQSSSSVIPKHCSPGLNNLKSVICNNNSSANTHQHTCSSNTLVISQDVPDSETESERHDSCHLDNQLCQSVTDLPGVVQSEHSENRLMDDFDNNHSMAILDSHDVNNVSSPDTLEESFTKGQLDVSETFITIETKDGLSSEKIPFSQFLKKVIVDRESGNLKVDLSQLLGSQAAPSVEGNDDHNTGSKKEGLKSPFYSYSFPSNSQTDFESETEGPKDQELSVEVPDKSNVTALEKQVKRRGRPPKHKQALPSPVEMQIEGDCSISNNSSLDIKAKHSGNSSKKTSYFESLHNAKSKNFGNSPRRSGRTPARSSRFGDDFVDSITLGKVASSSSTWNTQLMTLALAAETHKSKPNKSSTCEIDADEQHLILGATDDSSDYSPGKNDSVGPKSKKTFDHTSKQGEQKRYLSIMLENILDEKKKRIGGSGLRDLKTLKKYEPVNPVVKRSLKDAYSHAMEATDGLLSSETVDVSEFDSSTSLYYTIMEPKIDASGSGLLVSKSENGTSFKIVNFTGTLPNGNQVSNLSKSYPQDRYFSCDLCDSIFPSTHSWLQHNNHIHSRTIESFETSLNTTNNTAEYQCEFCEQRFPYKFMLDIHIKRKRHNEVKTFRCTLCKETFATQKAREEHWMMLHPARSCSLCGKQFTNIVMLRRHMTHNCHGVRFRKQTSSSEAITEVNVAISKQSKRFFEKDFMEDDDNESENDEESDKETDVEEGSDDVEENSSNSNLVKNESGKVECGHCGSGFSTYSGLWYHKLDVHHEYYPHGHKDKLKEKLEKNEAILQNAQDADLNRGVETNKNSFFVILKPKWPPHKSSLAISVDEKDFVFKPKDGKVPASNSLPQNTYGDTQLQKETSFSCVQCDETFQFASNYREHRSRVHGECFEVLRLLGAFQCTLCSETYPCQFMLDKHIKKHVGKKLLPCTLCGLFFHKIQERRLHWKTAHPGIGCPNCGKMYASIKYLQKHISLNCQDHFPPTKKFLEFQKKQLSDFDMKKDEKKVEKKIIQCHLCPKLCSSVHGWRRHMSEAHEDAGFSKLSNTCIICNELVYGYKALEKHLLENHAIESGLPVEEEDGMVEEALKKCEMDITAYRKAGRNNSEIYQDEKGNYHCPSCPKTHTDLRALRTHIRIHVNMKLECSICNKMFKNPTLLKQHVQRHRKDAVYSCDSCSKKFLTLQKLNKHRKVHHSTGHFVCDLCGMSFALNDYLQKHKRCHTDKRPHCCTICGKTFRTKPELRVHVLIHTRETPYKCQYCSRGFSQKGNYRIHLAQHTGEKPYQCDQCEISFALLCHLKRHKITHDQKINYRCMWCDKECTQRKHMQMHVQRVHKEDFYQYEEQMKLEAPVPIAPSQVKLYNRRLGKVNKVRKQYRTRAQKCDSTIQQLMNGVITKPEPMDEDTETSQNIVIEPIVEPMLETVTCDMHVTTHDSGGFEILVSEENQNYAKHAIPVDLMGQDPSNVEIIMGENNEINIIIKDPSALQDVVGDQESLGQLSGSHLQVQESLQQVVEALVSQAKNVCDEDSQLSLSINELEKSALSESSQILPFDSS